MQVPHALDSCCTSKLLGEELGPSLSSSVIEKGVVLACCQGRALCHQLTDMMLYAQREIRIFVNNPPQAFLC